MSAPPYMKLYIADYLAETTHLDVVGHGAYLLLIMAMWRAGGKLPRDEAKLARIAQCTPDQWAGVRDDVMAFFKVAGGTIKHSRVAKEIAKYDAVIDGAKSGGKASASKRANKNKDMDINERWESVEPKSNQPEPEPEIGKEPPIAPQGGEGLLLDLAPAEPLSADPVREAFDAWNQLADRCGLPKAEDLTDKRRRAIKGRLEGGGLPRWKRALAAVEASAFCLGQSRAKPGEKPFRAHIDFVCQASSFQKLIEGFYGQDAKPVASSAPAAAPPNQAEVWRGRVDRFVNGSKFWDSMAWGERPGRPGCTVPAEIQRQFGIEPAPPLAQPTHPLTSNSPTPQREGHAA